MKKEYIKINGVTFENLGAIDETVVYACEFCRSDIYDVYKNPSWRKVGIWEQWCKWAEEIYDSSMDSFAWIEISSHNSQFFSIVGQVRENGQTYRVLITPAHNRAWLLK